ncbi:hypothetical protein LTR37_018683 [Vermiconidia calcicola]|uniref:Uncharacterized protein n=1 Tax=Vermiconidia calcicola TaxID=1690605 RepID=A0ACC3MJ85_9PEZI|nr:hypothetical protein LTR37_018683 [Vermiconidia calcicola]
MLVSHTCRQYTTSGTAPLKSSRRRRRVVQYAIGLALFLLGLIVTLLILRYLFLPLLVYYFPSLDARFYDLGAYGFYPEQQYHSFNLTSPIPHTPKWKASVCDTEHETGGLVLIDLHGTGVSYKGPTVLDLKGNLIWTDDSYGQHAMGTKVQTWRGEQYLTFWAGDGNDHGDFYMLDSGFNLAQTVSAVGDGVWGDPHEFKITEDDTALIIVYHPTHVDLSSTHMPELKPYIVDAWFQEVDIASGELLFEWRASDHFGPEDGEYLKTSYNAPLYRQDDGAMAHDYFHMNSIDKDAAGNYLVSIRHINQIICVSSTTGEILWGFGEPSADFEDLSDDKASGFRWQHDARWVDEEKGILGLFDNALEERHWYDAPYSEGKLIHLDVHNKTAKLLHSYKSLQSARSTSQGSFQYISGENTAGNSTSERSTADRVFIGWGSVPAYTIHDAESEELLCETHYAPSMFQYYEFAKSYRGIRAPKQWKARPEAWDPSAVVAGDWVYVSWNGGMEVRWWMLQKRLESGEEDVNEYSWEDVDMISRDGFESSFELHSDNSRDGSTFYRIAALDAEKHVLRYSNVFEHSSSGYSAYFWAAVAVGSLAALVTGFVYTSREGRSILPGVFWIGRKKRGSSEASYTKLQGEDVEDAYPGSPPVEAFNNAVPLSTLRGT